MSEPHLHPTTTRSGRHYRTRQQRQADLVDQIITARNLRAIAYEQADRLSGVRRARLFKRAADQSANEVKLMAALTKLAPWHWMVRRVEVADG